MIDKRISILLIFILGLVLFGCEKEECNPDIGINGEWEWVESVGGWGTNTPQNTNTTRKLEFDNFLFREFVNDSLIIEAQYELGISEEPLYGVDNQTFINFESRGVFAIKIEKNKLEYVIHCDDCPVVRYKRK